jgi:hypothetical protein
MITRIALRLRALLWFWVAFFPLAFTASSILACDGTTDSTGAHGGQTQLNIAYGRHSPPASDYDFASVLFADEKDKRTPGTVGFSGHFADFLAAEDATATFQYSLRANADGYYPVMQWGNSDPVFITYLQEGDVWKFGTSVDPAARYSQTFLNSIGEYGVSMEVEFTGTEQQTIMLQNMKIDNYQIHQR